MYSKSVQSGICVKTPLEVSFGFKNLLLDDALDFLRKNLVCDIVPNSYRIIPDG
jgi:hypothetical protein